MRLGLGSWALVVLLGLSVPMPPAVAAPAPPPSTLEALLARTKALRANEYQKTLDQTIRALKNDAAEEAACALILAIVDGDVAAFMRLVPEKGLRVVNKAKKRGGGGVVSHPDAEKQAAAPDGHGHPSFLGLLNEVAEGAPKALDWGVELVKGRLRINANGAFAWADLRKGADGRFLIEQVTISANDD